MLATGWAHDWFGPRVLLVLPVVAATVPALAFADGVVAAVADLVDARRRSTTYGMFAAVVGVATAAGGAAAAALYDVALPLLIVVTIAVQMLAVVLLATMQLKRFVPDSLARPGRVRPDT